ncbi:RDD family protein [Streptomonospora nanhaiensis]|uniref:Putative RDD family membrane protein YckC n=1 Tax=Streptomonospora nanhaiensis TaxID=1323731 RepID=A0A853BKC1_9ACTN|nr:RDD family protein [Streptomonospora nanhaiensis]MBV2362362.1 RDD family protein [Streptomonospora nanhaiensis]MBX9390678.1 RDD family protein [Streptomonospora nanhaiensis]NYI94982.1 putative RDD family membrane protein YckC [Streptomonospora nanhaiensis]
MGDTTGASEETPFRYRGNRLGMPEHGPGSVPGIGRRLLALLLDWLLCLLVASALAGGGPGDPAGAAASSWPALLVFAGYSIVLLTLFGTTLGKRIVGIEVAATGDRPLPWPVAMAVRTLLLCLVIPAVVYDRDHRGLHDRVAGTITRRL